MVTLFPSQRAWKRVRLSKKAFSACYVMWWILKRKYIIICAVLYPKDTEYMSEEPGWCGDARDNVFYIILITPQPLPAGPGPSVTSLLRMFRGGWELKIKFL